MSYILDALRKSDQQRRRGEAPTLLAPQAPMLEAPLRRLSVSHGVLAAAALLTVGIVIGVMRPWQTEQSPAPSIDAVTKPLEPATTLSPVTTTVQPPVESNAVQEAPAPKAASRGQLAAATRDNDVSMLAKAEFSKPPPSALRDHVPAAQKEEKPAPEKADGAAPGDGAQDQRAVAIAELPQSIQQELPKMTISVHAYSGMPKDRLVGINDRVLREGEYLAPGLLLEQVTLEGVIMSYKGYRFRRGVR